MAVSERFQFGFAYHRLGITHRWRSGGSTLRRIDPAPRGSAWRSSSRSRPIALSRIDVLATAGAGQDVNDLAPSCEAAADAEFRRRFPDVELAEPPSTAYE